MVTGMNNSEIADKLVVSRSTIKYHVSNILSKLQATSRTEAVAYALAAEPRQLSAGRLGHTRMLPWPSSLANWLGAKLH